MRIITDPAARAIAYENGEIHMGAFESLPRIINRLKKVDSLTVTCMKVTARLVQLIGWR